MELRAIKMGPSSQDVAIIQTFCIVNSVGSQPKKDGRTRKLGGGGRTAQVILSVRIQGEISHSPALSKAHNGQDGVP